MQDITPQFLGFGVIPLKLAKSLTVFEDMYEIHLHQLTEMQEIENKIKNITNRYFINEEKI